MARFKRRVIRKTPVVCLKPLPIPPPPPSGPPPVVTYVNELQIDYAQAALFGQFRPWLYVSIDNQNGQNYSGAFPSSFAGNTDIVIGTWSIRTAHGITPWYEVAATATLNGAGPYGSSSHFHRLRVKATDDSGFDSFLLDGPSPQLYFRLTLLQRLATQ